MKEINIPTPYFCYTYLYYICMVMFLSILFIWSIMYTLYSYPQLFILYTMPHCGTFTFTLLAFFDIFDSNQQIKFTDKYRGGVKAHLKSIYNTFIHLLFTIEPRSRSSLKLHWADYCNITGINIIKLKMLYFFYAWIPFKFVYYFLFFIFTQLCVDESWQRVNFNSSVNFSDLALSGEMRRAIEMKHLQPNETDT